MDMKQFLSWNLKQPYPAYDCPELIRTGTADPTGHAVWRRSPG